MANDAGCCMDGAVQHGRLILGVVAKEEMSTSATAGLEFRWVRHVAMDMWRHFAGTVPNDCIRMGCTTIEMACDSVGSGFGAFRLFNCDGAKSNTEGVFNCTGAKKKLTNDVLNAFDALWGQWWRRIRRRRLEIGLAAMRSIVGMGCVFRS